MSFRDKYRKRIVLGWAEWVGTIIFLGIGLAALPFVRDVLEIQMVWLTICSAIGVLG